MFPVIVMFTCDPMETILPCCLDKLMTGNQTQSFPLLVFLALLAFIDYMVLLQAEEEAEQ